MFIILNSIDLSAVLTFKIKEVFNDFLRLFERNFFITIRVACIKVYIRLIKIVFFCLSFFLFFALSARQLSIFSKFFFISRSFSFLCLKTRILHRCHKCCISLLLGHPLPTFKICYLLSTHLIHGCLPCFAFFLVHRAFELCSDCKKIKEPFMLLVTL